MGKDKGEEKGLIKVALAGNPNVGKSTLFNSVTGRNVHTGNWAGKTVGCDSEIVRFENYRLQIIDIPGTYSLFSHSEEERIARDYICFGGADVTVVVCDAGALKQNLNLALQIAERGGRVILYLNLLSEAERNGLKIDVDMLSSLLNIKVVSGEAYKKGERNRLLSEICNEAELTEKRRAFSVKYPEYIEAATEIIFEKVSQLFFSSEFAFWVSLRLLDAEDTFLSELLALFGEDEREEILKLRRIARETVEERNGSLDSIVESIILKASEISDKVTSGKKQCGKSERLDKILTGRISAFPIMLLFLFFVLWITLSLANYPSLLLSSLFSFVSERAHEFFKWSGLPIWLSGLLIDGIFKTVSQVVAVMLPPMVIFFPLFSLLEDSGYLPRIAYNLDRPFACSGACGKQALTMCMGLGCNAVGIVGCRIIDSKRERNLAIVTNALMPCNGRLPMLITLISIFCLFVWNSSSSAAVALILSLFVLFAIASTFISTAFLSRFVFKGEKTPFTLELVPFRKPRFFSVIFHSLKDKCLSVLLRAISVAAPMGFLIWLMANISFGSESLILILSDFLEPLGAFLGMDGVILLSFILGLPANEIVIPIMLMIYSSSAAIGGEIGLSAIRGAFDSAGWTSLTVICAAVFALFHWPCSTSLITVYKETKSKKLTLIAFLLPTAIGFTLCALINFIGKIFF